jgi:arginine-tRNA-protein transferase
MEVRVQPVAIDPERARLFDIHKQRFKDNIPNSLEDFLGPAPQIGPCQTVEVAGYLNDRLIAASYLDVGVKGVSSIYAFFDPEFEARRLGVATMLWELIFARSTGKKWHYPGYCYVEPSGYDYKKHFQPMFYYDWQGWDNRAVPVEEN